MLILPIVNKKRVMNVELKLKNASKIKKQVHYADAKESDIIVNHKKFTESMFATSQSVNAPVDFIRSKSLLYPRNFLITTKEEDKTARYDVYEVPPPPKKVNDSLDELYSKAITDMRKEIPGRKNRGRYVSLEEIGLDKHLSQEKIDALQTIVKDNSDSRELGSKLKEANLIDIEEIVRFLDIFQCTILSDSEIPEESLQETLEALSILNTRDYRNLNKYYKMAKNNADIFTKISYINKLLYNKPLTMNRISSVEKHLVKKKEDSDYANVA